jgi:GDP-mannose 6-dehydrogenase
LGLGYVGSVTAACFAELGNQVIGVDPDEHKLGAVMAGKAPFFEPRLEEIVACNVAAGRLTATAVLAEALRSADLCFICVGTPSAPNNDIALEHLRRVCNQIAVRLPGRSHPLTVVIRSTVFPGTCEEVVYGILKPNSTVRIVMNPEFLREGSAVSDFMEPSLVVVGGDDAAAVEQVAQLYAPLRAEVSRVSLRTAEIIKYACNVFHGIKITFANEMGALCDRLQVPAQGVMATVCRDTKLNISPAYLRPGFAFGGSCIPKDLRALSYRVSCLGLRLPLIESVLASNQEHLRRTMRAVDLLPAKRIGIYGLAFKENTDDLRESPVVLLVKHLLGNGRKLRVFDPHIQLDRIYGSNREFVLSSIPRVGHFLDRSLDDLLGWADYIVVTQRPSSEEAAKLAQSGVPIMDVAGVCDSRYNNRRTRLPTARTIRAKSSRRP